MNAQAYHCAPSPILESEPHCYPLSDYPSSPRLIASFPSGSRNPLSIYSTVKPFHGPANYSLHRSSRQQQVRNPYVQSSRKAALGVTDTHHTAMMSVTRRKSMETCTSAAFWSAPEFQDQPLPARDSSYRRRSFSSSGAQLARQRTPDDDPAWIQASQTYPAAQAE